MEHYKLYSDYLAHWRPKGSENGKRNYQYKDGTYTPLGKARRRKGGDQFRGSDSSENKSNSSKSNSESGSDNTKTSRIDDILNNPIVKEIQRQNEEEAAKESSNAKETAKSSSNEKSKAGADNKNTATNKEVDPLSKEIQRLNLQNQYDKALATYKENRAKENVSPVQKQLEALSKQVNSTSNFFGWLGQQRDNRINATAKKKAAEAVKTMSNQDIQATLTRMDLESKYISKLAPETHKNEERMKRMVATTGTLIGIGAGVVKVLHQYEKTQKKEI